ncbi:MAG: nucleotidyltransferase family protein [Thermoguttaceae bacterium]
MSEADTRLTAAEMQRIKQAVLRFPEIDKAVLYGSRAKGTAKNTSDVDIAIFGSRVALTTVLGLSAYLNEETNLPYFFDILYYDKTENQALKDHVDRVGKPL